MSYQHIRHLEGLRSGATRVVQLGDLEGLITFPSFHAASALLFTWAAWPFRRLRWWIVGLNVLLVASTPIDGAHYAIDLVAGIAVAGLSIAATQKLCALLKRNHPSAFVQRAPEPLTQPRAPMGYSDSPAFFDSAHDKIDATPLGPSRGVRRVHAAPNLSQSLDRLLPPTQG